MLPQLSGIPLQSTEASSDSARNLNQLLPVGKNVSATVVAVSRDQVQPEIFKLKLEINNRLIQMGVFQALPVGQKININRQSDGQIQINPQPTQSGSTQKTDGGSNQQQTSTTQQQVSSNARQNTFDTSIKLQLPNSEVSNKLPDSGRVIAAVISSRPVYPAAAQVATQTTNTQNTSPAPQTNITPAPANPTPNTQASQTSNIGAQGQATANTPSNTSGISTSALPSTLGNTQAGPQTTLAAQGSAVTNTSIQAQANPGSQATQPQVNQSNIQNTTTAQPTTQATQPNPTTQPGNTQNTVQNPQPSVPPAPTNNPIGREASVQTSTTQQQTSQAAQTPQQTPAANQQAATRSSGPPSHHAITLALPDGSKVEVNAPRPLPQGTQVLIQKTAGNEAQVIKIQTPSLQQSSALDKPAIQETLRNSLPNQIPVADAFSQLAQTAARAEGTQAAQISTVVKSMLQLFGVRPGSRDAPTQIKQNIELGGFNTERSLSKGQAPNPQDMKSQLQQLQNMADKLPEEQRERFEQLLRGLHSRVTSQQLGSLQQWRELPDGGFERVLQLDLPIKQGEKWENLELRLSREGGSNASGEMVSVWRVRLHFDLEEQGGVDAEIRLTDNHEISTLFWCDQPETAEKLRARSEEFAERLRNCGFSNSEVQWHQGTAPEQKQTIHKQLVDLHT